MVDTAVRRQKASSVTGSQSLRRVLPVLLVAVLSWPSFPVWAANWNPLPDTGQTTCYDTKGIEVACPTDEQPLFGQDAQYLGEEPTYLDNGNQTVTDQLSGLTWMKSDDGTARTWQEAVDYCAELDFGGQSDWQLPTKFMLESIVDYGRFNPALNPVFNCKVSFYWSSTPHADNPEYAWSVFSDDGVDHWVHTSNQYYVRCVRAGL